MLKLSHSLAVAGVIAALAMGNISCEKECSPNNPDPSCDSGTKAEDDDDDDGDDGDDDDGDKGGGLELIDDMEDDLPGILEENGRQGSWYGYHDEQDGSFFPDVDAEEFEMTELDEDERRDEDSEFVVHVEGSGFDDYGSGFGFDFNNDGEKDVYDASDYIGMHFWAKRGEDGVERIRFKIGDSNTTPEGEVCDEAAEGCYNHWGIDIDLEEDWEEYEILFSELAQEPDWGDLFEGLKVKELMGIEFSLTPDTTFDVYIDDVSFIKKAD